VARRRRLDVRAKVLIYADPSLPKWVSAICPIYPQQRPKDGHRGMSQMCRQKQTNAPQQLVALFDHLVGAQLTIPLSFGWAGSSGLGNTGCFSRA
jgi:hypothetical protein